MTSRRSTASAPQGSRPSPARRTRAVLVSALAVMLVAGCGVRLETPPPSEPEPDSLEVARRASVTDVLDVAQLARDLLVDRSTEDPAADQLASTVDAAAVHLDLLGGVYDSGLADGPNDDGVAVAPTGSASPSAPTAPDMDVLVERLTQAYSRSRGSLTTVPDPGLARL